MANNRVLIGLPDRLDKAKKQIAELEAERDRLREALQELADNKHGFSRPAGAIAKAALNGEPLPGWE